MDPRFHKRLIAARPDLADIALKGKVDAERFVEPQLMQVTEPVLDLYASTAASSLASQLLYGEDFSVLEQDTETGLAWGQAVRDGYVGYVPLKGLGTCETGAVITARATHAYPQANMKTLPNTALPFGGRVAAKPEAQKFCETELGFIPAQHLDAPLGTDFVSIAERLIGAPYLWGGRSSFGLDCSALVQIALHAVGREAPRDSDMQEAMLGELLPDSAPLARSDLIFWKGHVGIMTDSETLLHANSGAMAVALENFDATCERIKAAGDGPVTSRKRLT